MPEDSVNPAIQQLNYGYGLDGGGYSFEEPPEGLQGLGCFAWDSPDPDCVPWIRDGVDYWKHNCHVYAYAPQYGHFRETEWPAGYVEDELKYKLLTHGSLTTTDRECHCHGKWVPDDDNPQKQKWEFSGNVSDEPFPNCERCGGDGYVLSIGGEWALYVMDEEAE